MGYRMDPKNKHEWVVVGATNGRTWAWIKCLEKWRQGKWALAVTH